MTACRQSCCMRSLQHVCSLLLLLLLRRLHCRRHAGVWRAGPHRWRRHCAGPAGDWQPVKQEWCRALCVLWSSSSVACFGASAACPCASVAARARVRAPSLSPAHPPSCRRADARPGIRVIQQPFTTAWLQSQRFTLLPVSTSECVARDVVSARITACSVAKQHQGMQLGEHTTWQVNQICAARAAGARERLQKQRSMLHC